MNMENDVPRDGHILHAAAYPRDAETITFHLMYAESLGGKYEGRQFQITKGDAESLARQIFRIVAEPDTQTAWENIAKDVDEEDHDI
jgi:hypothetical protein